MRKMTALITAASVVAVAGCGSSSSSSSGSAASSSTAAGATTAAAGVNPNQRETLPPGDIPDTIAYVPYTVSGLGLTVSTPEGWSRVERGGSGQVH